MTDLPRGYEKFNRGARPIKEMKIRSDAVAKVGGGEKAPNPFVMPDIAPNVVPSHGGGQIAMDSGFTPSANDSLYQWASDGRFEEGVGFLGFPYLAQLAQRAEYRKPVEIVAEHVTRKFIELKGEDEARLAELYQHMDKFKLQSVFRQAAEQDGFFGRSHVFFDFGDQFGSDELATPLLLTPEKIGKGSLRSVLAVEAMWCYPADYEAQNPLSKNFYNPEIWYVMGQRVHRSRLVPIVGREVPDMLKAAYAFGGLSMTQMGKPYVDNWLRTRQSVSDLLHSFSTMVLKTDMSSVLQGGCSSGTIARAQLFTQFRDNRGLMVLDKNAEDLENVSTPLSNLSELQQQSQEQQASVFGVPLVILLGITPSGMNASSDGEVRTFYSAMNAYQERVFRDPVQHALNVLQLDLWGEIDPDITFIFPTLWDMDEKQRAEINKINADADAIYIDQGVVSQEEVRERLSEDENSGFGTVDLSGAPPEMPMADFETAAIEGEPVDMSDEV